MSPSPARRRSGITLTEILISILIMGVGLISLATLFPLGLIRLREATRQSRSALLGESASNDLSSKSLLSKPTFNSTWFGPYYDPFLHDVDTAGTVTLVAFTPLTGFIPANPVSIGTNPITGLPISDTNWVPIASNVGHTGGGLPICYDPLWWKVIALTNQYFPVMTKLNPYFPNFAPPPNEARFGAGIIWAGGNSVVGNFTGATGGAYGLQRITNFVPWINGTTSSWPFTYSAGGAPGSLRDAVSETFVSPEDVVMQNAEQGQSIVLSAGGNSQGVAGSVVPEVFNRGSAAAPNLQVENDWRYSWLFTGRQIDTTQGSVFEGDVVVMDSRPFAFEQVDDPSGNRVYVPVGETVVNAVFGYSTTVTGGSGGLGYGAAADRTVQLSWPATVQDPEIKIGSWIADVTYERQQAVSENFFNVTAQAVSTLYPLQRCHWYQVAKKGDVVTSGNSRTLVVYTTSQLKSRTLLNASNGTAAFPNTALIMPSVINVFPRVFYIR